MTITAQEAERLQHMTPEELEAEQQGLADKKERRRRRAKRNVDAEEYGPVAEPEILSLRVRKTREGTCSHGG